MPLLVGSSFVAPPTTGGAVAETVAGTWIAPDGTEWPIMSPLADVGWFTRPEITGWGLAPITVTTDPDASGGTSVRHVRTEARVLTWPLHVYGATHTEFLSRWRALADAFAQTIEDGPGTLRIQRPDGTAREIEAYYQSGWDGEPEQAWLWDNPVLALLCPNPWWRDTIATTITRGYATTSSFLDPYPTVGSSQTLGVATLTNPGEITAWPTWRITGPADSLTATNDTTGEAFVFTPPSSLTSGQTATITTRPMSVRGPAGENWSGSLDWPTAALWGLRRGNNAVEFTVGGSGPGTAIELEFYPRYRTA